MEIRYNLVALLAISSFICASNDQTHGTITNTTQSDMKIVFYEHPYSPSLVGLFGFKSGEREKNAISHKLTTYLDAECTARFNKDIAGVSLPTKQNPVPHIYLIDPQHVYTLKFNENGKRILTTLENGIIQEPITFEAKHRAHHLVYVINEYIEAKQINEINRIAPEYRALRNAFPKETNEIETKFGLTNNNAVQKILTLQNNPMQTITEYNKTTECKVEELD